MPKDQIDAIIDALTKVKLDATRLADDDSPCVVHEFISTGSVVLDAIMGAHVKDGEIVSYGGLPCGRIVEIYGDTSTGKSLIAQQACAMVQEEGGIAVYIDPETAVSLPLAEAVGVDTEALVYLAPDTVEDVFLAMESVAAAKEDGVPMLIVWDSIAATSAKAEMDKTTGDMGYPQQARIISQGLRKFTRTIAKTGVACLLLNQAKEALGVMFGDRVALFGGKAVGFHSSVRVEMSVSGKIKAGSKKTSRVIGINVKARVVKNKIAPPFREAVLPIYFGHGIEDDQAMFQYLKAAGMFCAVGGPWYAWSDAACIELETNKEAKFQRNDWAHIVDTFYEPLVNLVCIATASEDLI